MWTDSDTEVFGFDDGIFDVPVGRDVSSSPAVTPEPSTPLVLDGGAWNPVPDIFAIASKVGEVSLGALRPATTSTLKPASSAAVAAAASTVTRRPFPRALVVVGLGLVALVVLGRKFR